MNINTANSAIRLLSALSAKYPTTMSMDTRSITVTPPSGNIIGDFEINAPAYVYNIQIAPGAKSSVKSGMDVCRIARTVFMADSDWDYDSVGYGYSIQCRFQNDVMSVHENHIYYFAWLGIAVVLHTHDR